MKLLFKLCGIGILPVALLIAIWVNYVGVLESFCKIPGVDLDNLDYIMVKDDSNLESVQEE